MVQKAFERIKLLEEECKLLSVKLRTLFIEEIILVFLIFMSIGFFIYGSINSNYWNMMYLLAIPYFYKKFNNNANNGFNLAKKHNSMIDEINTIKKMNSIKED